jgi:diguanylate cyclase (GGDEF)-like protein
VGDIVLKKLAQTLRSCLRAHDETIRYGGEEFVVLLYRVNQENALIVAEKIRKHIKKTLFTENDNISVTVSIGVSLIDCKTDLLEGIKLADRAMYMAKQSGKDKVVIYQEDMIIA